jgi:hypothetical protein
METRDPFAKGPVAGEKTGAAAADNGALPLFSTSSEPESRFVANELTENSKTEHKKKILIIEKKIIFFILLIIKDI